MAKSKVVTALKCLAKRLVAKQYDFEMVKPVFDKEAPELLKKLNDYFKKNRLSCYFTLINKIFFSDGYRMALKFNAVGDKKGREWYQWIRDLDGMENRSLVFKRESNNDICLKST